MSFVRWLRSGRGNSTRGRARPPGRRRCRPLLEPLEDRTLLAGNTLATALPVGLNDSLTERLGVAGEEDFFTVTLTEPGLLTAQTQPAPGVSLASRLSLLGSDGLPLLQSDGT